MKDINLSCGDNNRRVTAEQVFKYEKEKVEYCSIEELSFCSYIGGLGKNANVLNKH
jgi:hypothetical protein